MQRAYYELIPDEGFEFIVFIPPLEAADRLVAAAGRLLVDGWPPISAAVGKRVQSKTLRRADLIVSGGIGLLMRESAFAGLRAVIDGWAVPLPVETGEDDPILLLQCRQVDCLDRDRSVWSGTDAYRFLDRPVLRRSAIGEASIFGLPRDARVFVSATFRDAVTALGLRGAVFREVEVLEG